MRTPLIAGKLSQNDMPISSEALFKERSETITFVSRLISCKSQSKWGAPYLRGEDIVRPLRKLKAARNSGYNLTNYIEQSNIDKLLKISYLYCGARTRPN